MAHLVRPRPRVVIMLCALLSVLLLSACGGASNSTSSGPVTLTFGWWSNGPQNDKAFAAWTQLFTKTHPNITIKPEFLPFGDYFTKLQTSAAGGNVYDLIGFCSCRSAPYYANQQAVDLSTFPDYHATVANISSGALQNVTYNGHPYSLPLGVSARVIGYNKAMFAAAGVPTPDPVKPMTMSQFVSLAKQLSIYSNGKLTQAGLFTGLDVDTSYLPAFFAKNAGASFFDNYVNPHKITINTPEGIQALTNLQSLWTQHIEPSVDESSWQAGLAGLQSNRVAMTITGPWEFSQFDTSKYGVMPMPVTDSGEHMQRMTINSLSIYSGTKHKAEAWEFLKWAAQSQQALNFGKFADTPVNTIAFSQFRSVLQPAAFYPTLQVEATNIQPYLLSTSTQLMTDTNNTLQDLARGKLTPTQAAAQLQQQGNTDLSGS